MLSEIPSPGIITIVTATDEHYVVLLAALIKSIESNHRTAEKICLYIIEDGVSLTSKNKLRASVDVDMIAITWIKMTDAMPPKIKLPMDHSSYPPNIYMRLFMDRAVAPGTQKALFLDVDMIVLDDISKLWHIDLGDKIIGAVQDSRLLTFDNSWGGILNYKELCFAANTKYFNTGLLLVNIPEWKKQQIAQCVITCVNMNTKYANYPDQYGLNIALANQWLELDPRWNYFADGDLPAPFIIHFISRKPIYNSYANNPTYKQLFLAYLNQTQWHNYKPVGELRRYIKKVKNIGVKMKDWARNNNLKLLFV